MKEIEWKTWRREATVACLGPGTEQQMVKFATEEQVVKFATEEQMIILSKYDKKEMVKYLKGHSKLCFCPCIVKNLSALSLPNGNNLLNNLRNLQPYLFIHAQ